jgi:diguanylate cyclase
MRYGESREQSAEYLRLALPLMAQQDAGFHPVSFTLWYEHVAGVNPKLSALLAERLEAKKPLQNEEAYELYARHIVERDMETLQRLQQRLSALLDQAAQITAQAGNETGQFQQSLEATQHRLSMPASLEGVRAVVSELLSESQKMQVLTQAVVEKLDFRAQEVGELRDALAKAQSEALMDALTGLKNRRAFERAARELAHENAGGLKGAVILLFDIDHFKQVNDTYGHLLGDRVLCAVAHVLQANIKGRDLVSRFGGEEFAVLLVRADTSGALALANQIRIAVSQGRIRTGKESGHAGAVTVSVGMAVAGGGESLESVLARADTALYEAKRSGRNRVCQV